MSRAGKLLESSVTIGTRDENGIKVIIDRVIVDAGSNDFKKLPKILRRSFVEKILFMILSKPHGEMADYTLKLPKALKNRWDEQLSAATDGKDQLLTMAKKIQGTTYTVTAPKDKENDSVSKLGYSL